MARPALVGRSEEISRALLVLRRSAQRSRGALVLVLVLVSGEAGIGKTALVGAVVQQAERMGFGVGARRPTRSGRSLRRRRC